MINIGELRVGNIVLYTQDNDELPVLKIDGDKKTVCLDLLLGLNMELNEQDIDPIPLTPEWLGRCGFVRDSRNVWVYRIDEYSLLGIYDDGKYELIDFHNAESVKSWDNRIEQLHQLQNLYFALSGEELQIKLP